MHDTQMNDKQFGEQWTRCRVVRWGCALSRSELCGTGVGPISPSPADGWAAPAAAPGPFVEYGNSQGKSFNKKWQKPLYLN